NQVHFIIFNNFWSILYNRFKRSSKYIRKFILFKTNRCDKLTSYLEENKYVKEFYRISGEYNYIAKIRYSKNSQLDDISRETTDFAFSIVIPVLS
ncbi:TPA: Lrp/AsnC ligand binding domain-containing protein, partial [Enterococcus faecalis]|nr:Lrp/AsnC ligand binding domain-containing protein [Enterococcus faecalis]